MICYARILLKSDASIAEKHESLETARRWIEAERIARPASFRQGQIAAGAPCVHVVEIFDSQGWKRTAQ